jgi:hypothetical protein
MLIYPESGAAADIYAWLDKHPDYYMVIFMNIFKLKDTRGKLSISSR